MAVKLVPTIQQDYESYLKKKRTRASEKTLCIMREDIFDRLFQEVKNILDNDIFLALIEEEKNILLSGDETIDQKEISGLVGITLVLLHKMKNKDVDYDMVKRILDIEYPADKHWNDISINAMKWFIDVALNKSDYDYAMNFVMDFAAKKKVEFPDVAKRFYSHSPDFVLVNSAVLTAVGTPDFVPQSKILRSRNYKICLATSMLNYSLGDNSNAKYFLYRAIQFNLSQDSLHRLHRLVNKVVLLD